MKKVAIFVEGQTELHFVHRLVNEIAGHGVAKVELWIHRGGSYIQLRSEGVPEEFADVLVMLVNCGGDGSVKSSILERRELLAAKDFKVIMGLQDLFPKSLEDRERFEAGLAKGLEFPGQSIQIFLAIAEVEAWFLSESTHFERVDPTLSLDRIRAEIGFDPSSPTLESDVPHPTNKLKEIYGLVDRRYRKREAETHSMVSHLDFDEIYTTVRSVSSSLDAFISSLESAICVSGAERANTALEGC
ncbi:hypothetical protein JET76_08115 [Pseudomonas putida]|uniref:hypothetical protein n=1 Tax=Pseudomonas putida TaxID=303 RepID=UPI0018E6BB4A|nr:hypothetical protein [Pseudomonas putida]MBI6941302.1 hypothetical protein [Pseudomonas putida]MBI6957673.1 hypothetical protein [Pseudomonas putida]